MRRSPAQTERSRRRRSRRAPRDAARVPAALLRVVCDAVAWAASRSDAAARSLLRASQVPPDDAAALLLAARPKNNLLATIAAGSVVLSGEARAAANAFAGGLERIAEAFRTQGATAREVVETIRLELGLEDCEPVRAVATALDRACELLGRTWEPQELLTAFERELEPHAAPAESLPAAAVDAGRPVKREPERPPQGRRRHFSASSLNLYAECARKWFFRYLCGAVEDKPSSASTYGTAFHAALDAFHHVYPQVANVPPVDLARRLEGEINTAFERYRLGFASEVEYRLNLRRAQRTARRYLTWLSARAKREPFEVVGCEIEANVDMDGVEFVGYIDRVDREPRSGRVTVIDYKTGSIAQSAAEYRAKINAGREFQLPYYYWAQTAAGETVRSIALVPLRESHLEVDPIELEIVPAHVPAPSGRAAREATRGAIPVTEMEKSRGKMIELSHLLASGTLERFPATTDPTACRYCVYAPSCRERPADDDRRFGR
jgi:RecB family exonuclease